MEKYIRIRMPYHKIKTFYSYRTAIVNGFSIEDDSEHTVYYRVKKYIERNGYLMDNHICFTTENDMNFMWSDGTLVIGNITVRNW